MYTRSYTRASRYSPPPGYAGNTFTGEGEVKHHPPQDEIVREAREKETTVIRETAPLIPEKADVCERDKNALLELLKNLRGRLDTEELLILAVILLIAEDGVGPEILILALILIAG